MKRISLIILSIFLIHTSPVSAGVGDVYYCISKELAEIKNFKLTKYKDEKFTFKRTAQGLIFGNEGYFSNVKKQKKMHEIGSELFRWGDEDSVFSYDKGRFTYVFGTYKVAVAMQGTCSVF